MLKVLMLNHTIKNCGVFQFGKRVYDLVSISDKINYLYREIDSASMYFSTIEKIDPDFIVYNWHSNTMKWLKPEMINTFDITQHYFYFHEEKMMPVYDKYLFFGDYDFGNARVPKEKSVLLPRPLLEYTGTYPINSQLTIGGFGFAFWSKGFHTLCTQINKTMRNVHIRFHMPTSYFGDPKDIQGRTILAKCKQAMIKNNSLIITRDFLDDDGVLSFLAGNDINVFNYGENGEGISSVIDYALSVKRPIAISKSMMFRHIHKPEIILDKHSIQEIYRQGTKPLEEFYEKWSPNKFRQEMDKVFLNA